MKMTNDELDRMVQDWINWIKAYDSIQFLFKYGMLSIDEYENLRTNKLLKLIIETFRKMLLRRSFEPSGENERSETKRNED